ncbi:MAG: hypothetical protein AVDCRST_MAG41-2577 [uncultured Corynebacteriales bacterium]|uniref:SAF domain-containing protein n=1 Tax=uncultured Mycobacteriales bacterium TaxID=581187 RepID=A0A6J4IX13_9ACTN|nr:MAG: hypothetical protein AVDCRST_MAG41-2577 [uncultured Corynebacteriales bacterium]
MDIPPSPPARRLRPPSWLDPRLVAGVLLVAVSTATGARIIATADRSVQVWALTRDVAASTVLAAEDVRPARVRLFDSAPAYLDTAESPAGRAVTRGMRAGELLPATALRTTPPALVVNLPVRAEHAPAVTRGQAVDVWAGTEDCGPRRVLASAAVQEVRSAGTGTLTGGGDALQVLLRVGPADAERLLAVLGAESTVRLVVVEGGARPGAQAVPCRRAGTGAGER